MSRRTIVDVKAACAEIEGGFIEAERGINPNDIILSFGRGKEKRFAYAIPCKTVGQAMMTVKVFAAGFESGRLHELRPKP